MLNKLFINIYIFHLLIFFSYVNANEPVDIWNTEKKNKENVSINSNSENQNEASEIVVIQDNSVGDIEQGEILSKRKIVGLYDPEENGLDLEMWNNTDPKKIFELSKRINSMELSNDAKSIIQNFS